MSEPQTLTEGKPAKMSKTENWRARQKLGTIIVRITDAAACLDELQDAKQWRKLKKILHEIENESAAALVVLANPEAKYPSVLEEISK